MPEMRCAGCMQAGIVVFMNSVLCGECFFRQTVVARAVRGSFDATIGRPLVKVAPAPDAEAGDRVGRVITRLQQDLSELLSVLTTPGSAVLAAQRDGVQPDANLTRTRRRSAAANLDDLRASRSDPASA